MEKKKRFALVSILLSFGFYLIRVFLPPYQYLYQQSFLSFFFVFLVFFLLFFSSTSSWRTKVLVGLLPSFLTLGINFFTAVFFQAFWINILLTVAFALVFYLVCLVQNLFIVSLEFKTVPLYRAALAVNFILVLLASFFLFNFIFSLKFPPWSNGLLVGALSFFLFYQLFWASSIAEGKDERDILTLSLVSSWLLSQFALAISFWPTGVTLASLYLVSLIYTLGGILQSFVRGRLFRRTLLEYLWIGIITFLALFFSTKWRG